MTTIIYNDLSDKCRIEACCHEFVTSLVKGDIKGRTRGAGLDIGYEWEFYLCINSLIGSEKLRHCPYCGDKIGNGRPI